MTILVRMDDKMNRQLSCVIDETDSAFELSNELVYHGFINEADRDKLTNLIEESITNRLKGLEGQSSYNLTTIPSPPTLASHGLNGSPMFVPVSSVPINPVS